MEINSNAINIIRMGGAIAGAVTGTALTLLTDDVMAQFAAAGISGHLPTVINDFADRFLSSREKVKIGALEAFTVLRIKQNLENKKTVSSKFINTDQAATSIIELYEGVLLKAKNEFEEKKIMLLGNVFANSIFENDLNPHDTNHILNLVANLSYRKLCIIAFFARKEEFDVNLLSKPFVWYKSASFPLSTLLVSQDLFELREQGILDAGHENSIMAPDKTHLTPSEMILSAIGILYSNIIDFGEVEQEDILQVIRELEYKTEYGKSIYG